MAPDLSRVRVRLIQIRDNPDVLTEERESFRDRAALEDEQIVVTNAIRDPLTRDVLEDVDAVLIGGAGAYSVTQTYEWTQDLIDLCHACADLDVPLFGSCWGHQMIGRAFGGEVVNDPSKSEMGTHRVDVTEAGQSDPLFSTLPSPFYAQQGHQDRVSTLPPGAVEIATNDRSSNQAFRLEGLPIYGTQFHSELNAETERQRLIAYRSHYPEMADDDAFQAVLDAVRDSPDADDLLRRFLLLYAVEGGADELASL